MKLVDWEQNFRRGRTDGLMDGRVEANRHFSQFCKCA